MMTTHLTNGVYDKRKDKLKTRKSLNKDLTTVSITKLVKEQSKNFIFILTNESS